MCFITAEIFQKRRKIIYARFCCNYLLKKINLNDTESP